MKRMIAAALAAVAALTLLCACADKDNTASGGNLTQMKTVEEILAETPESDLVGKNIPTARRDWLDLRLREIEGEDMLGIRSER